MSSFSDRKNAFENKYAKDEEFAFKVNARRNKLVGLWAAELLGKNTEEADAYAKEVILSDFEEVGDDDVVRKVLGDLKAGGQNVTEHDVRVKMAECLQQAAEQFASEL